MVSDVNLHPCIEGKSVNTEVTTGAGEFITKMTGRGERGKMGARLKVRATHNSKGLLGGAVDILPR